MRIAIIGGGISGLGAAYMLYPHHDITVYEANDYPGGHSRTIEVNGTPVDTGFIVFNYRNYPFLTSLFDYLDVAVEKSDMSFGASVSDGFLEYGSKGIFAQKRNLLRPQFWRMIFDIIRFNKKAAQYLDDDRNVSLETCLQELNMGNWFKKYYLQAMGAAIWSCSVETILKFPAKTFIRFFENHGLLTINDHPQWYTVTGGSRAYVKKLTDSFAHTLRLNSPVISVERKADGVAVTDKNGDVEIYDEVVFGCHADQALAMIKNPSDEEQKTLSAFTYQENTVVVHSDDSFMPKVKSAWASWVYLSESEDDKNESVSLTYWMNNLQNIDKGNPIFVTLNPGRMPAKDKIYDTHKFTHPVFDAPAVNAQKNIDSINGADRLWFCGAYQRYGFHEDGFMSAVNIVKKMGLNLPWE
jgi:predicted NAD/FAD-binding protein